jgi:hypothetical protein
MQKVVGSIPGRYPAMVIRFFVVCFKVSGKFWNGILQYDRTNSIYSELILLIHHPIPCSMKYVDEKA